jgi:hypothetical protein
MTRKLFLTLALAALALPAMAKPNFSGTWKLDAEKSDFGPQPPPTKMTRTIKHEDPTLTYSTTQEGPQGEMTSEVKFTTDGKEATNQMMGMDVKGNASWEGDLLKIKQKLDLGGTEVSIDETWELSADGKVLTAKLAVKTPQGDLDMKVVMNKQ